MMAGEALTQEQRQNLSDMALRDHARAAAKIEHQAMTEVIETIREVNRRKLFLKLNYTSLFDYVRKDLGYEGGTAQSRIDAARLFEEVPSVKADFESGQLKITQVSVFSQSVKQKMREEPGFKLQPQAKAEILKAVKQLDVKQTQRFVAEKLDLKIKGFEKARVQGDDSVRLEITLTKEQMEDLARIKDLVSHQHPTANWSQIIGLLAKEYRKRKDPLVYEDKRKRKRTSNAQSEGQGDGQSHVQEQAHDQEQARAREQTHARVQNQATAEPNQEKTLVPAASDMSNVSVGTVAVKAPVVRRARSAEKADFTGDAQASMAVDIDSKKEEFHFGSEVPRPVHFRSEAPNATIKRSSKIPERIRRIVIQRDRCCQWVNRATGEICASTFQLEVDHRRSRWAGGRDEIENLHALCDHHNRLKYQVEMGSFESVEAERTI